MSCFSKNFAVVIPVLNGGAVWRECANALLQQACVPNHTLVIDSGSSDGTDEVARNAGFELQRVSIYDFDHGRTRQKAAQYLADHEILIFLTQDAVLASSHAFARLLAAFENPKVGVAYGRQLPRESARPIEAHARLFNYPAESDLRTLTDVPRLGIKAAGTSNSFAAYRTDALFAVDGFPRKIIFAEDMVVAARMLQAGWAVAYVADACVLHSHGYTVAQEFRRYFDIGVLHRHHAWMLEELGSLQGTGSRFVYSELMYLSVNAPWLIPSSIVRNGAKYLAYRLGQHSRKLPLSMKRWFSMNRRFWDNRTR